MARQERRRAAELKALRAELVKQLDRLDFRSESIGPVANDDRRPRCQTSERCHGRVVTCAT